MHIFLAASFALAVAGCVFLQGQADDDFDKNLPMRFLCTVIVTAILAYASHGLFPNWYLTAVLAVSSWVAFIYGPEIGWGVAVRNTQALKALWLTLGLAPFGLPYVVLRPLAYWIGYRKFTPSNTSDEVARALSGLFLGACIFAAIVAA